MSSSDKLWSYALGCMSPGELRSFQSRLERERWLRHQLEVVKGFIRDMRKTDPSVLEEPIPDRLRAVLDRARQRDDSKS